MSLVIFLYEGFVYNVIFLWRILPAVGKRQLVVPFMVLFNTFWGLAMLSYFQARTSDPGAIPERWYDFVRSVGDALPIVPSRHAWQPGRATYCEKCSMPRPERAHHCLTCDICVLRMDHHCPWINNCVGFNNHKYFLLLGIYGWLASLIALATTLPELIYCGAAVSRIDGNFALDLFDSSFAEYEGYISSGRNIAEERMSIDKAKERCASLVECKGFTFHTDEAGQRGKIFFKTKWDNVPNNIHDSGWTSYRLEKANQIATSNIFSFLVFGLLALFAAVLLYLMLGGHLPLATHNLTTIEANYDNMSNPFDHGKTLKNLEQVLGAVGPDWLVPMRPWRPLTDGVSFARTDEQFLGSDGAPTEWHDGEFPEDMAEAERQCESKERLWRLRYRVRPPMNPMVEKEGGRFWSCR